MLLFQSVLAFTCSFVAVKAQTATSSYPDSTITSACQLVSASSRAAHRCGAHGSVSRAAVLQEATNLQQAACAKWCLFHKACKSFSFAASEGTCQLFSKSLKNQGFLNGKTKIAYWNRDCFSLQCPVTQLPDSPPVATRSLQSLPTDAPSSVFNPPVPTDYSSCLADPDDNDLEFSLLDPIDGIPVVNNNGKAQKANQILDTIPQFQFSPVDGVPGQYDLMLDGDFLAATLNGDVIFVEQSSGLQYVDCQGVMCITSLFTYGCDGVLSVGIPGVVPYIFGTVDGDDSGALYAQPDLSQYNPSAFSKRGLSLALRTQIAQAQEKQGIHHSKFFPAPTHQVAAGSGIGLPSSQRCPNTPTGLVAVTRTGARPAQSNGCGSSGISGELVPNLWFEQCCDGHDICYDTCSDQFDDCNQDFGSCNRIACANQFGSGIGNVLTWGCDNLADFYQYVVSGPLGVVAFSSSTSDRCACQCPNGQDICNGGNACQDLTSDPQNCGTCGNVCPSGACEDAACLPVQASNDPCTDDNYYWYNGLDQTGSYSVFEFNEYDSIGFDTPDGVKRTCCQFCQAQKDCVWYQMTTNQLNNIFGVENVYHCHLGLQSNSGSNVLSPPQPSQCPSGGLNMGFSGLGQGNMFSSFEPGPCNTQFCCN